MAIKTIWDCWNDGTKLEFRGDYYQHTLMTPFFNPGPNPYGNAKILLAGVGELMTEVAGEVADGFLCHGFTTESYLRSVTPVWHGLGVYCYENEDPAVKQETRQEYQELKRATERFIAVVKEAEHREFASDIYFAARRMSGAAA